MIEDFDYHREKDNNDTNMDQSSIMDFTYKHYSTWIQRMLLWQTKYNNLQGQKTSLISDAFLNLLQDYSTQPLLYEFISSPSIKDTNFVDVSKIQIDFDFFNNICPTNNPYSCDVTEGLLSNNQHVFLYTSEGKLLINSIELPFEEGFYKVEKMGTCGYDRDGSPLKEVNAFEEFCYIKEITPELFEVISYIRNKHGSFLPIPIYVNLGEDTDALKCFTPYISSKYLPEPYRKQIQYHLQNSFLVFIKALSKLNKLNHHSNVYRYKGETPKQKYKMNGTKEYLRKTVYVYLNKEQQLPIEYTSSKLQREISWMVRGHWRRLVNVKEDTIGKNAKGIRDINDERLRYWTWVKPHMCGNGENVQLRTLIVKE